MRKKPNTKTFIPIKLILKSPLIPNHPRIIPSIPNTKGNKKFNSKIKENDSLRNGIIVNAVKTRDNREKIFSMNFELLFTIK